MERIRIDLGWVMMTVRNVSQAVRGLSVVVLASLLAACATTSGGRTVTDYTGLMEQGEAAVQAGQVDTALIAFADAAKADPTRKDPWVRTAQLEFDRAHYARAVVAAEEAMQRDSEDMVADGILTVSGFRIANQALERLRGRGALASATARREAETLVTTLRDTMGPQILGESEEARPAPRRTARNQPAQPRRAASQSSSNDEARPAATPPASSSSSSDPFRNIGGN